MIGLQFMLTILQTSSAVDDGRVSKKVGQCQYCRP